MKRGRLTLQLSIVILLLLSISTFVIAQEDNDSNISLEDHDEDEFEDEDDDREDEPFSCRNECKETFSEGEERGICIRDCKSDFDFEHDFADKDLILRNSGTNPDSIFYFLDDFFDRFGDELEVKEEKVAEIKAMVEKGDLKSARKALKRYKKYAKKLEKEVNPDQTEEAKRSALAIEKALREVEAQLSDDETKEFYDDIIESEIKIVTIAEIASKIKELCQSLSEIDPVEYGRICKTGDDAPKWQKKLDKDLTEDQRKEAIKFGKIMSECFSTSGQNCRCQEIPFPAFADACSVAAPLAKACDIDGDETACDKLDELEMPELPEHLQEIFDDLDDEMMEAQFEMHMPRECVEASITNPKECGKLMIETSAPEECKQALLDSGCERERECREICDKIMMEIHAPECAEAGITNPRDCEDFYRSQDPDSPGRSRGGRIDFNCQEIENAKERLECFDKAASQADSFQGGFGEGYEGNCMTDIDWRNKKDECRSLYGEHAGDEPIYGDSGEGYECVIDAKCIDFSQGKLDFEEIKEREAECARSCDAQGGRWDFSYGDCKCYFDDFDERRPDDDFDERHDSNIDCSVIYCGPGTDCIQGIGCVPTDNGEFQEEFSECKDGCQDECPGASRTECIDGGTRCECFYEDEPTTTEPSPDDGSGDTSEPTSDNSGRDTTEEPPSDDGTAPEGDNTITGNVFLNYMN